MSVKATMMSAAAPKKSSTANDSHKYCRNDVPHQKDVVFVFLDTTQTNILVLFYVGTRVEGGLSKNSP